MFALDVARARAHAAKGQQRKLGRAGAAPSRWRG